MASFKESPTHLNRRGPINQDQLANSWKLNGSENEGKESAKISNPGATGSNPDATISNPDAIASISGATCSNPGVKDSSSGN